MKYAIVKRPSQAMLQILLRRVSDPCAREQLKNETVEAVGLCQGSVLEVLVASDVGEKAAGVLAVDLNGSCPQHMTCLAVCGETEAVKEAVEAIRTALEER